MQTLYYLIAVPILFHELLWIASPIEFAKSSLKNKELVRSVKGLKWDAYPDEVKSVHYNALFLKIPMLLWFVVGLFTFQWVLFLCFLAYETIVVRPLSHVMKGNIYAYAALHWINSVVGFGFLAFIVINKYQLHYKITFQDVLNYLNI